MFEIKSKMKFKASNQRLKRCTQLQYNYNNITQKFCCIAAVRTSAIQLQYRFFTTAASSLQVICKL